MSLMTSMDSQSVVILICETTEATVTKTAVYFFPQPENMDYRIHLGGHTGIEQSHH